MLNKSHIGEESKRLIAHIRKHGPQGLAALRPITGQADSELRKRLRNLCTSGWLVMEDGIECTWTIAVAAAPLFDLGLAPKKPSHDKPRPMGQMPLPRQINVMQGEYVPTPFTPARQGAMDFGAIASRGVRC